MPFRINAPIRLKIVLLVGCSLAVSLGGYLLIAMSLFTDDKASYIYDYSLSHSKLAAASLEGWADTTIQTARLLGNQVHRTGVDAASLNANLEGNAKALGITGITFFREGADGATFVTDALALGTETVAAAENLAALGWTADSFSKTGILAGSTPSGTIALASRTMDSTGQVLDFLVTANPNSKLLEGSATAQLRIALIEMNQARLLLNSEGQGATTELTAALTPLIAAANSFGAGVRELPIGSEEFIVSYQRLRYGNFMIASLVPKSVAYAATHDLVNRSVLLDVSILLLVVGLALLLMRNLVRRIRDLVSATDRVRDGDFTVRVRTQAGLNDEVGALGASFNAMAGKITELMVATAEKARMEKELETAQVLQSRFFPSLPFQHGSMLLSGRCISASECGGDWWFYAQIENHLVVVVGDVTGHGVSSALITASVHGAFSTYIKSRRDNPDQPPTPRGIIDHLNTAVVASAGDLSTMTFVASVVDLKTGQLSMLNASHRPPYLYRPSEPGANAMQSLKPLMGGNMPALGMVETKMTETAVVQLNPGDLILWYTDGLFECETDAGKPLARRAIMDMLGRHADKGQDQAKEVCEGFVSEFLGCLGEAAKHLDDDVTVIVGRVPKAAQFADGSVKAA